LSEAAEFRDTGFYTGLMDSLIAGLDSEPSLLSLVSYVSRESLPVSPNLAQKWLELWDSSPDRQSTAKMLHLVALSDDAALYKTAVEKTAHAWREGRIAGTSRDELRAVLDGEFWVLSARTRNSGAGFVLKRTLAKLRRELGTPVVATNDR